MVFHENVTRLSLTSDSDCGKMGRNFSISERGKIKQMELEPPSLAEMLATIAEFLESAEKSEIVELLIRFAELADA